MASATYDEAFDFVCRDAVQYAPEDREPVHFGISLSTLRMLRGEPWLDGTDLHSLAPDECKRLLLLNYWEPLRCDKLPVGVDYFVFDAGVVYGSEVANRWLHVALGLAPTWPLDYTAAKLALESRPNELITSIEHYRRRYCKTHPRWQQYQEIWTNRTTRARLRALKMLAPAKVSA